MSDAVIHRVCVYRVVVPAHRLSSNPSDEARTQGSIVVQVETARGAAGWGEARIRSGLMGESADSMIRMIEQVYLPRVAEFHPTSFPEALEAIEALPWGDTGNRTCPLARAVVELALVDCALRVFDRDVDALVRWMGLPGFGSPGSLERLRCGGVLSDHNATNALKQLRRMYWCGVRDIKVCVGFDGDLELVGRVGDYLVKSIRAKRASLRVDAQGAWTKDEAIEWLSDGASLPLAAIEQPMPRGSEADLPILSDLFEVPLAHDESLVTMADAHRLRDLGVADVFHIDVDKCGGLIASLRLAAYARREGVRLTCGAVEGATGILAAANKRFLQVCPGVEWAEVEMRPGRGFWNVLKYSLRAGSRVQLKAPAGAGLGVNVELEKIRSMCTEDPVAYQL